MKKIIEDCIEDLENMSDEEFDDLLKKANFEHYNNEVYYDSLDTMLIQSLKLNEPFDKENAEHWIKFETLWQKLKNKKTPKNQF